MFQQDLKVAEADLSMKQSCDYSVAVGSIDWPLSINNTFLLRKMQTHLRTVVWIDHFHSSCVYAGHLGCNEEREVTFVDPY